MHYRCYNPAAKEYHNYGGRGITVCERWFDFDDFSDDMGERPEGTTLDRIDNEGNYELGNTRWATSKEQRHNSRQNTYLTWNDQELCLAEWAEKLNIPTPTLKSRYRRGLPVEAILYVGDLKSEEGQAMLTRLGYTTEGTLR